MSQKHLPADFPRTTAQGSISGAQPKLLLRKIGDTYQAGPTDDEVYDRYIVCDDLAQQLAAYASRKMTANAWSLQTAVSKVEAGVFKKVHSGIWDFSTAEVTWTIERARQILTDANAAQTRVGSDSNTPSHPRDDSHEE
ncbi:hypothetical protein QCE49_33065 [Caballeronia sp. LZ008]|uniref:hypothetical protein n=1 Tax=unclassified Caballeronia TaxID=2646786 RepID=UPI002028DFE3|nr:MULTISPECIES: hypothetical protein [unclassified Caballeronia]MDR5798232.1 hypothetical protein [Caballeronia sp. LZ008]